MMIEAINKRHSRRHYLAQPLTAQQQEHLQEQIAHYNEVSGLHIQLICDDPEPFKGLLKSYGMFSGVQHYLALVGDPADAHFGEKLGCYGEFLVLEATKMGLGSCWVGGTYRKGDCRAEIGPQEKLALVIALGAVAEEMSEKERKVYNRAAGSRKSVAEMSTVTGEAPDWFWRGMDALQKAPSAMNRQPVHVTYNEGHISVAVPDLKGYHAVDLGIGKLHFELGVGQGEWDWGNNVPYRLPQE